MNSNNVDVSVLMLAYNHEKYIRKALDSVLSQKFHGRMEILVGEDCSTDRTREILKEYAEKYSNLITPILNEYNLGATRNFFSILSMAHGKYLAMLECDDFWICDTKLQKQIDYLESHKDKIAVYHKIIVVDKDDNVVDDKYEMFDKEKYTLHDYERGKFPSQSASLVCRNFFTGHIEDYDIIYRAHNLVGDRTFLLLLLEKGDVHILDERMSAYREVISLSAGNVRSLGKKYNMLLEQWKYYEALGLYAKKKNIGIDMEFLKQLTFIQAVDRFLETKKKIDFEIVKKILACSQNRIEYIKFFLIVSFEQIKRRVSEKKTTADVLYFERKKRNGTEYC